MRKFDYSFWIYAAAVLFGGCATERDQVSQPMSVEKVPVFRVKQADGSTREEPTGTSCTVTKILVGFRPIGLQWVDGALWVTGKKLVKLDPTSNCVVATFAQASDRTAETETMLYRATVGGLGEASGGAVAIGEGAIWKLEPKKLLRLDLTNGSLIASIPVTADTIAVGEGSLWAFHFGPLRMGKVYRIDPKLNQVVGTIDGVDGVEGRLGVGAGALWVMTRALGSFFNEEKMVMGECAVARVNPTENRIVEKVQLGEGSCWNLAVGEGALWVTQSGSSEIGSTERSRGHHFPKLLRVDLTSNRITSANPVVRYPFGLAVGGGSVWVSSMYGDVCQVDPSTGKAICVFDVAPNIKGKRVWGKIGLVFAEGSLWLAGLPEPYVYRIDFEGKHASFVAPAAASL